ncbi:Presumed portal vertex protein, partial [Pantoea endophytica]
AAPEFVRNELTPLQERMREINEWLELPVINFKNYNLEI